MFKVGDKVLTIDPWFGNDLLTIVEFRRNGTTDYAIFSDGGFFRTSALRLSTQEEIAAGCRIEMQPKERPISRRRKRKLSKQGKTVYWSKHLDQYVYVMEDKA